MRLKPLIALVLISVFLVGAVVMMADFSGMAYWAAQKQRGFQNAMAGSLRAIQAGDAVAIWSLCLLTFAYGFVHAIGPGHGKVLLGGAALSGRATLKRMAALTLVSSLAQSATAVIIVVGGTSIMTLSSQQAVDFTEKWLAPMSYGAIALIGAYLALRAVRQFWRQGRAAQQHAHDAHGGGACDCGHRHGPDINEVAALNTWREMAALVVSIAIRPCTGALFLLVISWRFHILPAGVLATFSMGLGTAAFNLMVSGSGVGLRGVLASPRLGALRYMSGLLQLVGGLFILAISSGMLLQTVLY